MEVIRAGVCWGVSGSIQPTARTMPRPALRQSDLFAEAPYESDIWTERLLAAFADVNLHSGFLPLAEKAVEACPGEAIILMLAATAALLDERPQRALVFLKRFSKRASAPAEHLLHALALNQVSKRVAAKALLERHGLTGWLAAVAAFPGGSSRLPWLRRQLESILGGEDSFRGWRRQAARPKVKPRTVPKGKVAALPRKAPPPTVAPAPPMPPPLPRVDIEIPFTIEFDVAPLLSAVARDREHD